MTMRRSAAFIAARSSTDRGRDSAFIGTQFCQLSTPEVAIGQLGMRNDKVFLVYVPVAEAHDVEVQRPGPPALRPGAPLLSLDGLAPLQKRARLQRGIEQHHLIKVGRLL